MLQTPASAGELAKNLGIGGALFLTALWMLLKYKPWERKNGHHGSDNKAPNAGDQTTDYWKNQFREIVKEALEDEFRNRNETIRRIVREEVERLKGRSIR